MNLKVIGIYVLMSYIVTIDTPRKNHVKVYPGILYFSKLLLFSRNTTIYTMVKIYVMIIEADDIKGWYITVC